MNAPTPAARRGDWMQTYTGRRFWPLDPRPEDVCVKDIAHALALQTRFGGHSLRFYSVAEHCVHLARAASPEAALWLLLHDAAEAYIGDMVRPLKRFMPEFREAEDRITWAIYQRFGLDPAHEPVEVKALDNRILIDERAQNMRPTGEPWHYGGATEPLGVTLQFWTPGTAEREFLHTFARLTGDWSVTTYRAAEPETYAGMLTALADEIDCFAAHGEPGEEVPVAFTPQELHAISSSLRADIQRVPSVPGGEAPSPLRVESPDLHAAFAAMSPDTPLPWDQHPRLRHHIFDANGNQVCKVTAPNDAFTGRTAAMIVVAVNTCGGFKAEPAADMPADPFPAVAAREWWPAVLADEVMPDGRATPSAWLFQRDGEHRFGPDRDPDFPTFPLVLGQIVTFLAEDDLGRTRVTFEADGSATWAPRPPEGTQLNSIDDHEMTGDGPDDFVANLTAFDGIGSGEYCEVRVSRLHEVAFRFTIEDGVPRFVPVDDVPAAPGEPMAPPADDHPDLFQSAPAASLPDASEHAALVARSWENAATYELQADDAAAQGRADDADRLRVAARQSREEADQQEAWARSCAAGPQGY